MKTPQQIWICGLGKEPTGWIVERMISGEIAADQSFDLEASDGRVHVEKGYAVFQVDGAVYACPSRQMSEKLATIASDHPAIEQVLSERPAPAPKAPAAAPKVKAEPKPLKLKEVIGSPPVPSNVKIDDMEVDDTYQRSIEGGRSQKLIDKIAANFDWRLCLPLLGSRREGKIFIIDGQHRWEGAKKRGDIPWMPVIVYDFDDRKAEAELFIEANRARRPMNTLDDFHAGIIAGDEKSIAINTVVEDAGLVVGRNPAWQHVKAGEVVFTKTIGTALKRYGAEVATLALSTIAKAFDGEVLNGGSAIFDALCTLIAEGEKGGEQIEIDLMQSVLTGVGLKGWKDAVANVMEEGAEDRREAMYRELSRAYDEARAQ